MNARTAARAEVASVFDLTEADGAVLYLWDEEERVLMPLIHVGSLLDEKELPVVHPGQGTIGAVYGSRRAVAISEGHGESGYATAWSRQYGIQSEYAVPLIARRRLLGVLSVMYAYARPMTIGVQHTVEQAAKKLTPLLHSLQVSAQGEQSVRESLALAQLIRETDVHVDVDATCARVTETACRLIGADYGAVGVLEGDTIHFGGLWGARASLWRSHPKQAPFAGSEERDGRLLITRLPERSEATRAEFANSLAEGARTVLITPLGATSERLGSLVLGWRADVEPTWRQVALVEALAKHAAAVITHARAIARILGQQEEKAGVEAYRTLAERRLDLVVIFDPVSGLIRYASPSHRSVLGWDAQGMIGRRVLDFVLQADLPRLEEHIVRSRVETPGRMEAIRFRVRHADGSTRMLESRGIDRSGDPVIGGWLLISRDRTAQQHAHHELESANDSLGTLLDGNALDEFLHAATLDAHARSSILSLLVVHLEGFGASSGGASGEIENAFLRAIDDRLRSVLRGGERIGRWGSDEFVIIVPQADERVAREYAEALLRAMEEPMLIDDRRRRFETSIGIALYPVHGSDARTLLRHGNAAARIADRTRSGIMLYDMEGDRSASTRVYAVSALRQGIARDELVLHYQPIFDVRSCRVLQAEALCRWPSAPSGLARPDAFIPLAEHAGLIGALTDWVIRNAVAQWGRWRDEVGATLAINLSMENLAEPDLVERLARVLEVSGVEPSRVCLELTESALLLDVERSARTLEQLTELGVHFSIDDFGTGYTSLAYLKRFPVHELKIDRSFVTNVEHDQHNRTILRSIIDMAHGLGLCVVAEGVETLGALELLREWGCDRAQGYVLARAMPPEDFASWLALGRGGAGE